MKDRLLLLLFGLFILHKVLLEMETVVVIVKIFQILYMLDDVIIC